jgi:5-methylcytosine-specific restriction endonuclease McrA
VLADYLEVRANANIYAEPDRHSERVGRITIADYPSPLYLPLVRSERVNGYYETRIPDQGISGWLYKTRVRRHRGELAELTAATGTESAVEYVPYERSLYPHWVDEDRDCQNTRAEVLIRDDDDGVVEFKDSRQCVVTRGTWTDPYTGEVIYDAKNLDVDHVVPLKNVHESGGWAWTRGQRRAYSNYLGDQNHLLPVKASENRRKGARGPEAYKPPLASFRCDYARIWLAVKTDWELEVGEDEGIALEEMLASCQ